MVSHCSSDLTHLHKQCKYTWTPSMSEFLLYQLWWQRMCVYLTVNKMWCNVIWWAHFVKFKIWHGCLVKYRQLSRLVFSQHTSEGGGGSQEVWWKSTAQILNTFRCPKFVAKYLATESVQCLLSSDTCRKNCLSLWKPLTDTVEVLWKITAQILNPLSCPSV